MPRWILLLVLAVTPASAAGVDADRDKISADVRRRLGITGPAGVSGPLTETDAVATALANSPAFDAALASLGVLRADLIEAGLLRNPRLGVLFPVGSKPFELLLQAPLESLIQRPARVRVAQAAIEQAGPALVQTGLDLARDVKLAHAELWLAQRRATLIAAMLENAAEIARLTAKKLEAGDGSRLEVTLAQADEAGLRETESRARAILDQARKRLLRLMNAPPPPGELRAAAEDRAASMSAQQDLVEAALSNRPDLRSAELTIRYATEKAGWEKKRFLLLGASFSAKEIGDKGVLSGPGLDIELPIFHRNQGQVAIAEAEIQRAVKNYAARRFQVALEVVEAEGGLRQAEAVIERLEKEVLPLAIESRRLVESALQSGDVSRLDLVMASRRELDVRLRILEAQAELRRARAQIERAIGRNL